MLALHEAAALAAAVGSGLVAGLCFTFGAFVLRALDELGSPAAIRAMQSINTVILRSSAMVVWLGTLVLAVLAVALAEQRGPVAVPAALYALGALIVTRAGNIPLNEALDQVDPTGPEAVRAWQDYRQRWSRWNAARTLACAAACAGFALVV